jgi:hypothetical protein
VPPDPLRARRKPDPKSPLDRLLAAIIADPEAGPVAEWAKKLLAGDRPAKRRPARNQAGVVKKRKKAGR